jgi:hypothetical protein
MGQEEVQDCNPWEKKSTCSEPRCSWSLLDSFQAVAQTKRPPKVLRSFWAVKKQVMVGEKYQKVQSCKESFRFEGGHLLRKIVFKYFSDYRFMYECEKPTKSKKSSKQNHLKTHTGHRIIHSLSSWDGKISRTQTLSKVLKKI